MAQSKIGSLLESLTNTALGLFTSFGIQLILFPLLGIDVNLEQNLIILFTFFTASVLRGYIVRRVFSKIKKF